MEHRRWNDEPVEQMSAGIGRQVVHTELLTVARVHLVEGVVVPRHEHGNEQVANVITGRMRFVVGDEDVVVGAGESLVIPPNVSHEAVALTEVLVIDVFSPRRDDWIRGDDAYLRG